MILKALYDYYDRRGNFPPLEMEIKQIPFVIVIDMDGNFVDVWDTRHEDPNDRKKRIARTFRVAKGVGRSSDTKPNIFYDNPEYVLGVGVKEEKAARNHKAFVEKCVEFCDLYPQNPAFKAVVMFFDNDKVKEVKEHTLWNEIIKQTGSVSFKIQGFDKLVSESDDILDYVTKHVSEDENCDNICLVTGERCKPVEITSRTPLPGQSNGGQLVSFQVGSGFDSYGKEKCFNAPISHSAEAKYTAALKSLLEKGSGNKYSMGTRTILFWTSSVDENSQKAEQGLFSLFNMTAGNEDDPDNNVDRVKQLFKDIYSGVNPVPSDDKFYFLGLAPNSARIAVTYWQEIPLKEFAGKISRHFEDMSLGKEGEPYAGIIKMLGNIALNGKIGDLAPNLGDDTFRSIVEGTQYPYTLLSACIRRIRADQEIRPGRVAIIKAYLRRINDNNIKPDIMLDKNNTNQGYLCGRLFAVLDRVQEMAQSGKTLREGYLASASATPSVVFPKLLSLSVHHSAKLDEGTKVWIEKLKTEILSSIPSEGFPAALSLQDQGRFMIGYYHQRDDIFKKKNDNQ